MEPLTAPAARAPGAARRLVPRLRVGHGTGRGRPAWPWFLAILGLLAALYAERLGELTHVWLTDETYSHGWLVPSVSAYFAWQYVRRRPPPARGEPLRACCVLMTAGLLHLAAVVLVIALLDVLALIVTLHGLALLRGGRAWARGLRFPLGYLLFLCPLPTLVTTRAALWLQGVVTVLATLVLELFLPASREGNLIYLPGQQLEVGAACSGLRQMVAFVALALTLAHVGRRSWSCRWALVLAAVPVAVTANLMRVLLMALVLRWVGPAGIEGAWHSAWGLATMALGVFLFGVVGQVVAALMPTASVGAPVEVSDDRASPRRLRLTARTWSVGIACLGVTLLGHVALRSYLEAGAAAEPPSLRGSLASFPVQVRGWVGREVPPDRMRSAIRDAFQSFDDRLCRAYELRQGRETGTSCMLWIVYSRDGQDRAHHPLSCYEATGYTEDPALRGPLTIPGRTAAAQRFAFLRREERSLVYYWYYTLEAGGEAEPSFWRTLHRRLRRQLPSVSVEVFAGEVTPAQQEQLEQFARAVDAELARLLPPGARLGSDARPPVQVGRPLRHGAQEF